MSAKLTAEQQNLLRWLEDENDDIYVPPTKQQQQQGQLGQPSTTQSSPASRMITAVTEIVTDERDSDDEDVDVGGVTTTGASAMERVTDAGQQKHRDPVGTLTTPTNHNRHHHAPLQPVVTSACITEESEGRIAIVIEAYEAIGILSNSQWQSFTSLKAAAAKKLAIEVNNRDLIAADLIKELVESNEAQRSELQQLLAQFQMLVGGSAGKTPFAARGSRR